MSESELPSDADQQFGAFAFVSWLGVLGAFTWVECVFAPAFLPVLWSLEVELPGATLFFMDIGGWLQSPVGMSLALIAVGWSVLPFVRGRRNRRMGWRYLKAAIVLLVITAFAFAAIMLPINKVQRALAAEGAVPSSPRK